MSISAHDRDRLQQAPPAAAAAHTSGGRQQAEGTLITSVSKSGDRSIESVYFVRKSQLCCAVLSSIGSSDVVVLTLCVAVDFNYQ